LVAKKPSIEKAAKAFSIAYEYERAGNFVNAGKSYIEAAELYAALNDKLMEAEANFFAGHCNLLQINRINSIEEFKKLLKSARDFWEATRRIYIKLELQEIKPNVRGAIIDSSLFLSDLANLLEEQDLTKRKSKFFDIAEGLGKCSAIYEKHENFEKAGIVEYWSGIMKLKNYVYMDEEEREEILNGAITNFANSKKFFETANRERPSLCFSNLINKAKIARVLESRETDENKIMTLSTISEEMIKSQPESHFCEGFGIFNKSWADFIQALFVKNIDERFRLLQSAKKLAEQALPVLLKYKEQNLIAEAYLVSAMADKELSEMSHIVSEYEALLKSAHDNFRECLKYAKTLDETWLIAKALAEIPGIIADYSKFLQSEVLKRDILREGASMGREALECVKKLPNDFAFLGKLYESMAKYVLATSMISENKELTSDELERIKDLRSRAFRYGERAVEYFEKVGRRNTALDIASRAGFYLSKVGNTDQEKIEILERAKSYAETAIERYKSQNDDLKAAHILISLGFICEDLWNLSKNDEYYRRAKISFADASKLYNKTNWIVLSAGTLCKLAEVDDRKGNYKMSSDYYLEASKKYEQASLEHPELKDNVKFTMAMHHIELAKEKEKEDWVAAKDYYEKALLIFPKTHEAEANFFAARTKLLEAEALSMGKEGEKAAQLFSSAAQTFLQSVSSLDTAITFVYFAEAKAEIEKGLISDKEGKREAAIVHFRAAKEKMEAIPTKASVVPVDINAQIVFIKALSELEEAQVNNRLEMYQAAAQLFQECSVLFTKERMKNISKGYSDLCYGIENLIRCKEAEKDPMKEYINATTYFERAQKFFQEAGLTNYVDYLEAMKNYLDGIRYSKKLVLEHIAEAKMSYYSMMEKGFKNAIEIFKKSGYIYMKEEAASELEKIKREQTLREYLSLVGSTKTPEGEEGYTVSMPKEALENAFVILRAIKPIAYSVFQPEEEITIQLEVTNIGAKTATLDRIENIIPPDFKIKSGGKSKKPLINANEIISSIETITPQESQGSDSMVKVKKYSLPLNGKKLQKGETEKLSVKVTPSKSGMVNYQPTIIYIDENKNKKFFKLDIPILVS
jgi:tetratricopeptide (TPR) repeat protein